MTRMEHALAVVTDGSDEVTEQHAQYRGSVGDSTAQDVINDIVNFALDAEVPDFYHKNRSQDVWYEMLDKEDLNVRVGKVADAWVEDAANVQRAARQVQREITVTGVSLVRSFGFCRFKAVPAAESWYFLEDGPGVDDYQQAMVFIALEELGPHNGFPFPLSPGQDVCMDGNAAIWTPPTGGGLAICISLDL